MSGSHFLDATPTYIRARRLQPREMPTTRGAPGLRESLWTWAMLGVLLLAAFTTYARTPVSELYNVSIEGIAGGASQVLGLLNYPVSFIAIALMGVAVARLFAEPGTLDRTGRWLIGTTAVVATGMSLVSAFVVKQSDLDAKPANAIPALGVALALGISLFAVRRTGTGEARPWTGEDTIRALAIALIVLLALPWILADLGVLIGDVPLIGGIFMSKEIVTDSGLVAVHFGHHHGFSGALFAISAIVLLRSLARVRGRLRWPLTVYLAFMLVYGLTNAVQDFWGEQLVKRGTITTEFPSMIMPKLTPAWGLVVLATAMVATVVWFIERDQHAGRETLTAAQSIGSDD